MRYTQIYIFPLLHKDVLSIVYRVIIMCTEINYGNSEQECVLYLCNKNIK